MMLADFSVYLPEDLLCKVDRTSMAVSLEARAPLLDWHVAEFAWSLPLAVQAHASGNKYLLKQVLRRYLPDGMVDRGKRGFGAPVSLAARRPARMGGDTAGRSRLRAEGYFDADAVHGLWEQFLGGERKWHTHLWNVLMFQAWHEHWREQRRASARQLRQLDDPRTSSASAWPSREGRGSVSRRDEPSRYAPARRAAAIREPRHHPRQPLTARVPAAPPPAPDGGHRRAPLATTLPSGRRPACTSLPGDQRLLPSSNASPRFALPRKCVRATISWPG